jgi:hypothetical protein
VRSPSCPGYRPFEDCQTVRSSGSLAGTNFPVYGESNRWPSRQPKAEPADCPTRQTITTSSNPAVQGAAVCACTTAEGKRSDRPPKSLRRRLPQRGLLTWTHASSGHHRRLSKHKPPLLGQQGLCWSIAEKAPLRLPRDPPRSDVPQAGDVFPAPHCDIEHEHHEQRDNNIGPELDIAAGFGGS